ncbi:amidase [Pendulispora albinea]|uniref:Amidase domain-containing protein n=1 Tax=Pendulispora albinea TaxID=2741071 RepID=A0ABZ2LPF7_9BACT
MNDLGKLSAVELAALIRKRELSPVESVKDALKRIEQRNPALNAVVTVCAERALEAARHAETAVMRGRPIGPLHGVPIAAKDLDPVTGVRVTRGSKIFRDLVAKETIPCVSRLEDAGAIVIGKTNTPEFGYKATTDSTLFGPASTPFNRAMNAGGSSGGSAAAVAAGIVPLAQGSDAGGSLRVPAAFCGVFTMMTTFGRVAVPARPNAFRRYNPMVCYAPLARSVADAVVALDCMSAIDPRDPYSFTAPDKLADGLNRDLTGLRVAYSPDLGGYPCEPEVAAIVRDALPAFTSAGARVDEVDFRLPIPHDEVTRIWRRYLSVCHAESAAILRDEGIDLLGPQGEVVDREYLESVRTGFALSAVEFRLMDLVRTKILDTFETVFDHYDILVSPVNSIAGVPNASDRTTAGPSHIGDSPVDPLVGWSMTSPFNLIGSPAASVPAGLAKNGVPVGLQIAARRGHDVTVIAAAAAFERHRPWKAMYQTLGFV